MRQSNSIDDAMNDAVMVVDHQQKIKVILYDIRSGYFYLLFVLVYRRATSCIFGVPPAYRPSEHLLYSKYLL